MQKELEENTAMRKEIKAAVESGMPVVAECSGFLYLHTAIRDRDGHPYQMAGGSRQRVRIRKSWCVSGISN